MTRRSKLIMASSVLVVIAVLMQSVILFRVPVWGAGPDLVLLVVVAVALATSPTGGAITGFIAGLLLDVMPPDLTTVGATALMLTLAGCAAGLVRDPRGLAPAQLGGLVLVLSWLVGLTQALVAALFSDTSVAWLSTLGSITLVALITAVIALIVLPRLVRWLMHLLGVRRPRSVNARASQRVLSAHE
jgi:rod shape-determining protein MreD